ncbi:MAG: hypothetical protein M3021_09755 [Actinomycetota bacterium]|nr:hypothetical protein [Actinomycetota bacterium]
MIPVLLLTALACCTSGAFAGFVPLVNIPATEARLPGVKGMAVDADGNVFFVSGGYSVLRLDANTGILTSVAGNGTPGFSGDDGPATSAQLAGATSVAVDLAGNLYIADANSGRVRKVSNGVITTVAGNGFASPYPGCNNCPATSAYLDSLDSVTVDTAGNLYMFVNQRIRKVSNGVITDVAGYGFLYPGGSDINARFGGPGAIVVDAAGSVYLADTTSRIFNVANGAITTVAGMGTFGFSGDDGPATSAQLASPRGIAVDPAGNLYIADTGNQRIRRISNGVITTVAGGGSASNGLGDNGPATSGLLNYPLGVGADSNGNVYIEDTLNHRIRKVSNGIVITVAGGGSTPILLAQSAGTFNLTGNMTTARAGHTATLLPSGNVLIAGGSQRSGLASLASAEIYDPATQSFTAAADMTVARAGHTATLLQDGRVFIVGGYPASALANAELYDPVTETFAGAGKLVRISSVQTATLLGTGKVLITGYDSQSHKLTEVYDPSAGTFMAVGNLIRNYFSPTATLLPDGRVLVAGSNGDDDEPQTRDFTNCCADLYDPAASAFSSTGPEAIPAAGRTATLLRDGKVLLAGGNSAELYDPSTGTFAASNDMTAYRYQHTATLLSDGTALITGDASAELYDPTAGTFAPAGNMTTARYSHTATALPDGTVLITGGYGNTGVLSSELRVEASAELYRLPVAIAPDSGKK